MRVGVVLPHFQPRASQALALAQEAEQRGIDGVFCYDHLWPMGQPQRPALAPFPLLGAVAAATERIAVGTLVARVGLVPDATLLGSFESLRLLAPGRVIAGLGTGDKKSAAENRAYGLPDESAELRRRALLVCAEELVRRRFPVWVGGAARATVAMAREAGAAVNLWGHPLEVVPEHLRGLELTWGGPPPADRGALAALLERLQAAGVTWAVFGPPPPLADLGNWRAGR